MALLGVLALVLAGYLVQEALRASVGSPGTSLIDTIRPPAPPERSVPSQSEPSEQQRQPERSDSGAESSDVVIDPDEYVGRPGDEAAFTAKNNGLQPQVLDDDGDEVDRDRRSRCQVVQVRAESRVVPQGSQIQLICIRRGR